MNCPKCGYERQNRDDAFVPPGECPACGLVYAKHDPGKEPTEAVHPLPPAHLRPSPVDALSLRKARERVEKRLRERDSNRIKDDRHAQTLELAKRLTTEQVRKRQDEWKQSHAAEPVPPPAADNETPCDPDLESPEFIDAAQPSVPDEDSQAQQTGNHDQPEDQPADEIVTRAEAALQDSEDDPAPAVENPPEATDETETDAQEIFEEDVEHALDDADEIAATAEAALQDPEDDPAPAPDVENPTEGTDDTETQTEGIIKEDLKPARDDTDELVAAEEEMEIAAIPPHMEPEAENPDTRGTLSVPHAAAEISARRDATGLGGGIARLLPVIAWLILAAGVIGAILSWITIGGVESGATIPIDKDLHSLPLGLLLGFAYLATGVLGFAFFWVSSLISTQLRDIYRVLISSGQAENSLQDEAA